MKRLYVSPGMKITCNKLFNPSVQFSLVPKGYELKGIDKKFTS